MDPFTALILASLVTWGTVGSGIKDTAAIVKGQPPPSHALRMARMEDRRARAKAKDKQKVIKPVRHRRITLSDLLVHWWEDGLEVADQWRESRHESRPVRVAKRKEFIGNRKAQIKRGYALIKERGAKRFGSEEDGSDSGAPVEGALPEGAGDNVIPLRPAPTTPNETNNEKEIPMELLLGDKATYTAHDQALAQYHRYFAELVDRVEQITARATVKKMNKETVALGDAAVEQLGTVREKAAAARTHLQQAHQGVAEQRKASGNTQVDADDVQE